MDETVVHRKGCYNDGHCVTASLCPGLLIDIYPSLRATDCPSLYLESGGLTTPSSHPKCAVVGATQRDGSRRIPYFQLHTARMSWGMLGPGIQYVYSLFFLFCGVAGHLGGSPTPYWGKTQKFLPGFRFLVVRLLPKLRQPLCMSLLATLAR
ncbi:hypothetical protein D3C79_804770 [compost metagenome]